MLSALLLLSAAQTFTLEEAKSMPPEKLVEALIGKDHDPIEKVIIHPVGMEAPSKSLQEVTLVGVPGDAPDRKGWCRRVNMTVKLVPLTEGANGYMNALPTRVASVTPVRFYRWGKGDCAPGDASFFSVRDKTRDAQFALFDRLVAARDIARGSGQLPFALQCTDYDGARSETFGGDRCREGAGRALLANLPLERTRWLSPRHSAIVVSTGQAQRTVEVDAEIGMMDDALSVDATIVEDGGRITAIHIKRHIPYPF